MHTIERREARPQTARRQNKPALSQVHVLGVRIYNASSEEAVDLIEQLLHEDRAATSSIYIVNAHTLNLACESRPYRDVLNSGNVVFADGTGARWAARLRGTRLKANLVGTDLVPNLFRTTAGREYRYFLLGADAKTIQRAAAACKHCFPAGDWPGFITDTFRMRPPHPKSSVKSMRRAPTCCLSGWAIHCRSNGYIGTAEFAGPSQYWCGWPLRPLGRQPQAGADLG